MQDLSKLTLEDFLEGQVLLINKPLDWTSFNVVSKIRYTIRKEFNTKRKIKVGHAGTLDPKATGLLIICTGKFTKKIEEYQGLEKEYTGSIRLDGTTPCYDMEQEVSEHFDISHLNDEIIQDNKMNFLGDIEQIPPSYSAKFIEGERAYHKARRGEDVVLKARTINISKFEIPEIILPEVKFRIACSKGTYIRSIARDFGESLNVGGYLTELCRTRIGEYLLEDALSIDEAISQICDHSAS